MVMLARYGRRMREQRDPSPLERPAQCSFFEQAIEAESHLRLI